jgi:hypothetical protein
VSVPSCPTYDLLSEKVLTATTRYIKLGSRLEIAKLERDTERISELEPRLERAGIDRESAEEEYRQHRNNHEDAARLEFDAKGAQMGKQFRLVRLDSPKRRRWDRGAEGRDTHHSTGIPHVAIVHPAAQLLPQPDLGVQGSDGL